MPSPRRTARDTALVASPPSAGAPVWDVLPTPAQGKAITRKKRECQIRVRSGQHNWEKAMISKDGKRFANLQKALLPLRMLVPANLQTPSTAAPPARSAKYYQRTVQRRETTGQLLQRQMLRQSASRALRAQRSRRLRQQPRAPPAGASGMNAGGGSCVRKVGGTAPGADLQGRRTGPLS